MQKFMSSITARLVLAGFGIFRKRSKHPTLAWGVLKQHIARSVYLSAENESLSYYFRATVAAMFVMIHWLREFPLSAVTNRFELRCELKQRLLLYYKSVLVHRLLYKCVIITQVELEFVGKPCRENSNE